MHPIFFQLGWNLDGDWPIRRQNPYQHQFVNVNNNIFAFSINICFTFFNVQINMIRIKLYVRTFETSKNLGFAYIVYGQVALQQQLAQELTIDFSKNTDVSDSAKDGYVKESISNRITLSKQLGPPDRKLCRQNLDFSKPILLKADNSISLAVI
jgi:hypothetical protein